MIGKILVVGSLAYDTIETSDGRREGILGGSANYFCLAATQFSKVNLVGVVGDDYRDEDRELLRVRGVDLSGLQNRKGKTFTWEGKYEKDMNEAVTLATHLNVFEKFDPQIPAEYKKSEYVFLANIDPVLQMKVLDQIEKPRLVGVDTMNFWIQSKRSDLLKVFKRVDVLLINESEACDLSGKSNAIAAAQSLAELGPKAIVIKRGEYGFVLFQDDKFFVLPAFPVARVVDPTGAGDTFAGGFFGYLAKVNEGLHRAHVKQACIHGCLLASFTVQDFGVKALVELKPDQIEARHQNYRSVIDYAG